MALEWNVYVGGFNSREIEVDNVFDHGGFMDDVKKAARKYKDTERDKFEEAVRTSLMYYFWSKCEWEIIIDHWPQHEGWHDKKIDVFDQVQLNWPVFCEYLWSHRAALRRRAKKNGA